MELGTILTYASAGGGVLALIYAVILALKINKKDAGTERMKEIAASINEGAKAFLFSEYKILIIFVAVIFAIITAIGFITGNSALN
ncbi:MAG: sodium/proton-translocating pyrophosphatase, partial [Oscillospiraceae bacterium]|nr:sodium/proton-translocating pyrophosphatase [Oscillospiraceae bacterium]